MSKSVFIKSNIKIEKKTFINLIKEFFIKEDSYDNLLILQFKKIWLWLFFDESGEYLIQFSSDFSYEEIDEFCLYLKNLFDFTIID